MCTTCLRAGWRGINDNGKKLISQLDAMGIWPRGRTPGSVHLRTRLKRLWDFIRLQLHLHFEEQSDTAAHCLRLHLGSIAEPRFNSVCTHKHTTPKEHPPAPITRMKQAQRTLEQCTPRRRIGEFMASKDRITWSSTCTQYRSYWSQEWPESKWDGSKPPPLCDSRSKKCCQSECKKNSTCHCKHCRASFCRKHCAEVLCSSENMPTNFGKSFVCPQCIVKVDACRHSELGCATCDEIQYFKADLMHCAEATQDEQILGRARDVCKSIDIMVGHTARTANQERFWPQQLDNLRKNFEYDHVLLKSDYWKKFEGTVLKQGKSRG